MDVMNRCRGVTGDAFTLEVVTSGSQEFSQYKHMNRLKKKVMSVSSEWGIGCAIF